MKTTKLYQFFCLSCILFITSSCFNSFIQLTEDLKSDDPTIRRNAAIELSSQTGGISQDQICSEKGICIQLDSITANILGNELIKCLSDTNSWVRVHAIRGLADLKFKKASPYIVEKLRDPYSIAQEAAVRALGDFKDVNAVPLLIDILKESSANGNSLTEDLIRALGEIGDTSATLSIMTCLNASDNSRWLCAGLEALGNLKDNRGFAIINSNTSNPDDYVRSVAIHALGNLESELAIPNLINSLNSFDIANNRTPADLLAGYSDKVLEHLLSVSKNGSIPSRVGAIYAIGLIGSEKTIDYLIEMLKDNNDIVKFSALCALKNKNYREKGINKLVELSESNSGMTGLLADMALCQSFNPSFFHSSSYLADETHWDLERLNSFDDKELTYGAVAYRYSSNLDLSYTIPFLINMLDNNTNLIWVPQGELETSEHAKPTTPSEEAYQALKQRALKYKDADQLSKNKDVWLIWWNRHENEYRKELQSFWQKQIDSK